MKIFFFVISLSCLTIISWSQEKNYSREQSDQSFPDDSSLMHASVSMYVEDAETGKVVMEYNSGNSLIPASIMKLITSAAALELLGPDYTFKTRIGYTGKLNKRWGRLKGDIVILGGGDPALGSKYFSEHYQDFILNWITEIRKLGIKRIRGRVITDDSYYDYLPVPAKWLWEDAGNYYGSGVYGLSVFDNTYEIHFKTLADSTIPSEIGMVPAECRSDLSNFLIASGTDDEGYVFAAPYSTNGWLSGSIPVNQEDFILKASITDPPLILAKMVTERLKAEKIRISGKPTTIRLEQKPGVKKTVQITETSSPPLTDIIKVLNHESVNLFAEHLIKELGKKFKNNGSTSSGIEVVNEFLNNSGISTNGMFIEDGSGLSPLDAINTRELVHLLVYMKNKGKHFPEYYASIPDPGENGTLKSYFTDPLFDLRLKAKSGSMTRVRSFAGYFTTLSGKNMAFSIIINNYTGPSKNITSAIEDIFRELISKN